MSCHAQTFSRAESNWACGFAFGVVGRQARSELILRVEPIPTWDDVAAMKIPGRSSGSTSHAARRSSGSRRRGRRQARSRTLRTRRTRMETGRGIDFLALLVRVVARWSIPVTKGLANCLRLDLRVVERRGRLARVDRLWLRWGAWSRGLRWGRSGWLIVVHRAHTPESNATIASTAITAETSSRLRHRPLACIAPSLPWTDAARTSTND